MPRAQVSQDSHLNWGESEVEEEEGRTGLHRLQVLTVANSDERLPLVPALRLARIIDQLFPFLERVCVQGEETEGGRWAQVHAMVKMYQSVRADLEI